jgi:CelD/BcsL family acetyltransferase involved in cellulose biosynthesis
MKVRVIRPDELSASDIESWRAIQARAGLENPFLSPEFAQAVGRHRADARVGVMDDGSGAVGFFAFERRRWRIGKAIGAGINDCQAVVADPGLEWSATELVKACDLVVWEYTHLIADQAQFAPHHAAVVPSPIMDLTGGYEAFCKAVSANSKSWISKARRGVRRLEPKFGPVRFEYDDPDPAVHRVVLEWKSNQYRRTGRPDPITRPWMSALLADILSGGTETFRCVCSTLYAGDRLVAGQINLHAPRVMAGWIISYDPELASAGPGNLSDLMLAEAAAERGVQYIDLGKGDNRKKACVGTRQLHVAEGWVERPSVVTVARRAARTPVRATHDFIVRNPPIRAAVKRGLRIVGSVRR